MVSPCVLHPTPLYFSTPLYSTLLHYHSLYYSPGGGEIRESYYAGCSSLGQEKYICKTHRYAEQLS